MEQAWRLEIGAVWLGDGKVRFRVWAPKLEGLSVNIFSGSGESRVPLEDEGDGYFSAIASDVREGDRYFFVMDDDKERPDPASRFQPEGVHGPSQVVLPDSFQWTDNGWKGIPLESYVVYELHVGAFSAEGTFRGVIRELDYLRETGITAVELMPVAQFSGDRNWGYDGVLHFAPQNSYGGPDGLKELVDACHAKGLAVILDVVYNHLGPEGNYLSDFGYYFTDRYRTPWGEALNFDGQFSDPVRRFFVDNALYWVNEYHFDALRLDAVHGIFDFSARHFLEELAADVHRAAKQLDRQIFLIAESALNDVRVINPVDKGGFGIDAQWNDDFHHSLHTLLTGENDGYYVDFGGVGQLAKCLRERFVYSGEYSRYRCRRFGNSAAGKSPRHFVVFGQNHDQVGNRMLGERLSVLLDFEPLKLAACTVLLSPYIPLLFMGEEYGEQAPFLYFVSHSDPSLVEAVRKGRKEEFADFMSAADPPDPESVGTFLRSKIDLGRGRAGKGEAMLNLHKQLISMRKTIPALAVGDESNFAVSSLEEESLLWMERVSGESRIICVFNFDHEDHRLPFPGQGRAWLNLLDSAADKWGGPGTPFQETIGGGEVVTFRKQSCAVFEYRREE